MSTEFPGSTQPASVQAGLVIAGKYELLSVLGEGGMGTVWAATHLGLNQTVALKIISQTYARSAEARSRFDHEAKAAAKLKSRYVVQVFDNGELPDGTPYMAMELLEGESLAQRLARGPVELSEAASYLSQVGRALDRAHALGIVHRDIKPENIFLARSHDDESGMTVKVLDFGIAKIASPDNSYSHTRTGTLMGTPLFMSPEQARGLKTLDHRTDLYSLGLVVYTMLTAENPFGGESLVDLMLQVCTQPLPKLGGKRGLPPSLDAWLERASNREAELRFGSARELTDAFIVAAGISGVALPGDGAPRETTRDGAPRDTTRMDVGPQGSGPWTGEPTLNSPMAAPSRVSTTASSLGGAAHTHIEGVPLRSNKGPLLGAVALVLLGAGAALFFARRPVTPAIDVAQETVFGASPSASARPASAPDPAPSQVPLPTLVPVPEPQRASVPSAAAHAPPSKSTSKGAATSTPAKPSATTPPKSGANNIEVGF